MTQALTLQCSVSFFQWQSVTTPASSDHTSYRAIGLRSHRHFAASGLPWLAGGHAHSLGNWRSCRLCSDRAPQPYVLQQPRSTIRQLPTTAALRPVNSLSCRNISQHTAADIISTGACSFTSPTRHPSWTALFRVYNLSEVVCPLEYRQIPQFFDITLKTKTNVQILTPNIEVKNLLWICNFRENGDKWIFLWGKNGYKYKMCLGNAQPV